MRFASRQSWADLIRVVAIFGVVMIHACSGPFYRFGALPLADWLAANLLDAVVRPAVPLFVMLSGALLLKPGAPLPDPASIGRRVLRVLVPLGVWGTFYLWYGSWQTGASFGIAQWLTLATRLPYYHLWFVYMIIGLYLLLPVLQLLFDAALTRPWLQRWLLALWVITTCVPVFLPLPLLGLLQQTSLFGYGGYFVLGALLIRDNRGSAWAWALVWMAATAATFALTWSWSDAAGRPVEVAYQYFSPNVALASVAAFVLLARTQVGPRAGVWLQRLSAASFVLYFVHVVVLDALSASAAQVAVFVALPQAVAIIALAVATFVLSGVAAVALRRLPGAERWLG